MKRCLYIAITLALALAGVAGAEVTNYPNQCCTPGMSGPPPPDFCGLECEANKVCPSWNFFVWIPGACSPLSAANCTFDTEAELTFNVYGCEREDCLLPNLTWGYRCVVRPAGTSLEEVPNCTGSGC